jgi:hypothetical protein
MTKTVTIDLSQRDMGILLRAIDLAVMELLDRIESHHKHGEFEAEDVKRFDAELTHLAKLSRNLFIIEQEAWGEDR